jgi:hypothetical protein
VLDRLQRLRYVRRVANPDDRADGIVLLELRTTRVAHRPAPVAAIRVGACADRG